MFRSGSLAAEEQRGGYFIYEIKPLRVLYYLLAWIAGLVFVHLAAGLYVYLNESPWASELYKVFNIGADQNVPTHFAVSLWLFAAVLAWLVAKESHERTMRRGWLTITMVSLFISIDELVMIHERTIEPVRDYLGAEGYLWYAWVVPYGIGTLLLFLVLIRFALGLPRDILALLLLAGAIFVVGALGLEMVGANLVHDGKEEGVVFRLVYTLEEIMEMLGVAIFIYTLLRVLQSNTALAFAGDLDR